MPRKSFGFAARLRALRQAAGLTQVELAERSGVQLTSVTKLEAGTNIPQWPTVILLARALGVSLDQFVGEEGETPPPRPRGRPKRTPAEERARQPPPAPPPAKGRKRKGG
jgi:transcriptional regulator with XRE-family HTH domain